MLHAMLRAAAGRDRIPTDGLIAHYTMDNVIGSTLIDETGNYDGTITGATQTGEYLSFDGVNDKVVMSGTVTPFGALTGLSVSFDWYWPSSASFDTFGSIIGNLKTSDSSNDYDGFAIQTLTAGEVRWFGFGSDSADVNSYIITQDQWVKIVAIWDGTGLYFVRDNSWSSRTALAVNDMTTTEELTFGKLPYSSLYSPGRLKNVRVYDRALSAAEVTAIYNGV